MEHFRDTLLERIEHSHNLRDLLRTALRVYSVLGREILFSLFFTAHVVEKIGTHYRDDSYDGGPGVIIEQMLSVGGDFGVDLTEAVLRAMLTKKLLLSVSGQPVVIPPSLQDDLNACCSSHSCPYIRNATAIALRDWDGACIPMAFRPTLAFPAGARITNVVRGPLPR